MTPKKYGGLWVITEEMLINDELAAVPAMLRQLGDTIARTRASAALRAFRGQMADGVDVFADAHNNLVDPGTNITAAVLNSMDSMLKAQTSRSGVIVGRPGTIALCGISAYERIRQIYTPVTALWIRYRNRQPVRAECYQIRAWTGRRGSDSMHRQS